jgi:NitT/TauT family transport system substrate-binding protein
MMMKKRLTLMLEYFYPWTNAAGFYLARDKNYYAEAGLEIDFALFDAGHGDTLRYLSDGDVDFGVFPTNRLLVQNEQHQRVISVAAVNQRGMETIQTVTSKGIRSPRDLNGKRIALNPTPRGIAMVRHLVKQAGGDPDSLIFIDTGSREIPAAEIKAGDFDATFGTYWAWDVLLDHSLSEEERIIWPVDEIGAPAYHSYLLGTTAVHIKNDPTLVRDFLTATAKGYLEAASDPQTALPLFERFTPYLPGEAVKKSLPLIAGTWLLTGRWGVHQTEYMREYGRWLYEAGILQSPDSWQTGYTNKFLEGT